MIWVAVCVVGAVVAHYLREAIHGLVGSLFVGPEDVVERTSTLLASGQGKALKALDLLFVGKGLLGVVKGCLVAALAGGGSVLGMYAEWHLLGLTVQGMFGGSLAVGQWVATAYMATVVVAGALLLEIVGIHTLLPQARLKQLAPEVRGCVRRGVWGLFFGLVLLSFSAGVWRTWASAGDSVSLAGDLVFPAIWNGLLMGLLTAVAALFSCGVFEGTKVVASAILGLLVVVVGFLLWMLVVLRCGSQGLQQVLHRLVGVPIALGALLTSSVASLVPPPQLPQTGEPLPVETWQGPAEPQAVAEFDMPPLSPEEVMALSGQAAESAN